MEGDLGHLVDGLPVGQAEEEQFAGMRKELFNE